MKRSRQLAGRDDHRHFMHFSSPRQQSRAAHLLPDIERSKPDLPKAALTIELPARRRHGFLQQIGQNKYIAINDCQRFSFPGITFYRDAQRDAAFAISRAPKAFYRILSPRLPLIDIFTAAHAMLPVYSSLFASLAIRI